MQEPASDEDQRMLQEMIGRYQAPSFIRRARLVESTWQQLVDRCAHERLTMLEFVRLRLGQLHALAGWDQLSAALSVGHFAALKALFEELQPRLRLPLEPTTSRWVLRGAAAELLESIERFNERWPPWLAKLDLGAANRARDAYNRYFLLEKECAFGSATAARRDFQRLPALTLDDVARRFPLLVVPAFDF